MSQDNLAVYLQDHRAGAVAAVELLTRLENAHANTSIARFVAGVRTDVCEDIEVLDRLMDRVGIGPSRARGTAAWLTEKVADLKMRIDDSGDGSLRLLESLEALAIGIDGKHALWIALAAVAERVPALAGVDYQRLVKRAETQRRTVETERLSAAEAALAGPPPAGNPASQPHGTTEDQVHEMESEGQAAKQG
jgi:hypothetical protein